MDEQLVIALMRYLVELTQKVEVLRGYTEMQGMSRDTFEGVLAETEDRYVAEVLPQIVGAVREHAEHYTQTGVTLAGLTSERHHHDNSAEERERQSFEDLFRQAWGEDPPADTDAGPPATPDEPKES